MKKNLVVFILLLNGMFSVFAQVQITGLVKDKQTGELLIGVSVIIKNTTLGTYTDNAGKFSITVPASVSKPELRFSYLGYTSQDVTIASQQYFEIALEETSQQLKE